MVLCQSNPCFLELNTVIVLISPHASLGDHEENHTAGGEDGRPRTVAGGVDDLRAAYVDC